MANPRVGDLMREWRERRRRSQLDLSLDVGVSTRHLSFVETGRARPSPELVLAVAEHLDVPLRERNTMLLAAGYAPRYSQRGLDEPAMERVRRSLQRMLDAHDPYPGVVIDRQWNVLLANQAAGALSDGLPEQLLQPTMNVFRVCLHPDGLARRTANFDDWASYLLRQLRRTIQVTGDPEVEALECEIRCHERPAVAGVVVVGVDRRGPLEAVRREVLEDDVDQVGDVGVAGALERWIDLLAVSGPHGREQFEALGPVGLGVAGEVGVDGAGQVGSGAVGRVDVAHRSVLSWLGWNRCVR